MTIDTSKRYFFVGNYYETDVIKDFIDNSRWRSFDYEDEHYDKKILNKVKNMRPGDIIFLKNTYTTRLNLPFENVKNSPVSVMRIYAAGIIVSIDEDGHGAKVNWMNDYTDVEKLWYFYTSTHSIWQINLENGRFAIELIEFAMNNIKQDYSQHTNIPSWSHFRPKTSELSDTTLKKNIPFKLTYEDFKGKKLLAFKYNDSRFDTQDSDKSNITWKEFVKTIAKELNINEFNNTEITVEDVFPDALDIRRKNQLTMMRNVIGFYQDPFMIDEKITQNKAAKLMTPVEIIFDDQKFYFTFMTGIDALLLIQGMLNKFGKDGDIVTIYYKSEEIIEDDPEDENNDQNEVVVNEVKEKNSKRLNTILYGPPGTGKTYAIEKYKKKLIDGQENNETVYNFEGLSWRHAIYLAFKSLNYRPLTIKEIENTDVIKMYAKTKKSKVPYGTISTTIIENSTSESTNTTYQLGTDFFEKDGKKWRVTEVGKQEAEEIDNPLITLEHDKNFMEFVTFHQSYGYEDFIEGIRAEASDDGIKYIVRDGVFLNFCKRAMNDIENGGNNNYLFVIDEINRGNISKIFGELITLVENNKRISFEGGEWIGHQVTLPYSGESFGVPENVHILGTMNTADRSISSMDSALRRRFEFVEMMPDSDIVRQLVGEDGVIDEFDIANIMDALNNRIQYLLSRDYTLGHAIFLEVQSVEDFKNCIEHKVIPLLQEYFFDDYQKIKAVLNDVNSIYISENKQQMNKLFDQNLIQDWYEHDERLYELNTKVDMTDFEKFARNIVSRVDVNA